MPEPTLFNYAVISRQYRIFTLLVFPVLWLYSVTAAAYSYSSAGKEPVLDAWVAVSHAVQQQQWKEADQQLSLLEDELVYLESETDTALVWPLRQTLADRQMDEIGAAFNGIFSAVIEQRLLSAQELLSNYQQAKIKVAKSQRFLEMMLNDPALLGTRANPEQRQQLLSLIKTCMNALGNPGLFGAGAQPADKNLLETSSQKLIDLLRDID